MDACIKLTDAQMIALRDIESFSRDGYPGEWKPKTREKLQALGLVENQPLHDIPRYFLTDAGRSALSQGEGR